MGNYTMLFIHITNPGSGERQRAVSGGALDNTAIRVRPGYLFYALSVYSQEIVTLWSYK